MQSRSFRTLVAGCRRMSLFRRPMSNSTKPTGTLSSDLKKRGMEDYWMKKQEKEQLKKLRENLEKDKKSKKEK